MRKGLLRLSLLGLALASACADDPNQQPSGPSTTIGGDGSRIHRAESGPLTASSRAVVTDIVRDYLHGFVADAVDQLSFVSQTTPVNGVSHVRYEQVVGGLRVHGAYVKVAITDKGELVQVIENLAPAVGLPRAANIKHKDALAVAMKEHGYDFATPGQSSANGNKLRFDKGTEFYRDPTVEKVAYYDGNALKQGYLVETWSLRGNQLDHTLIGSNGSIVAHELRTQNESYNVFLEDPEKGGQQVVTGSWLNTGSQTTQNIRGPNVNAYIDADANNAADSGGTSVTDGNFLTAADLTASPGTAGNRNVAVQNLFYLNNVMHDRLALAGFTVATGNFEGNDPVNAEAQDGSGTDNANMSTPTDGSSPRMQMYLWTGRSPTVKINTTIGGYQSSFGPAFTSTPVQGPALRTTPADGCTTITTALSGSIAMIDRGSCDFTVKVLNAQNAGAKAVIIVNNTDGLPFAPGGTSRKVKIPSAMIALADAAAVGASASMVKNTEVALQRDGDVDSDIVYHEYGHGLTWRKIGSMSGALSGAIGEGASDTLAFLMNGDGSIGEYSFSDPVGIRRYSYEAYALSYADVNGAGVHNDGEIYAAAMFRTMQNYNAAGITASVLLDDWVQSMELIAPSPSYEHMRDGLVLQVSGSTTNTGLQSAKACHVWRAFASMGIGLGSSSSLVFAKGKYTVKTVSSFSVPAGCQ